MYEQMNEQKNKIKTSIKVDGWVGGKQNILKIYGKYFEKKLKNITPLNLNIDFKRNCKFGKSHPAISQIYKKGVPQMLDLSQSMLELQGCDTLHLQLLNNHYTATLKIYRKEVRGAAVNKTGPKVKR